MAKDQFFRWVEWAFFDTYVMNISQKGHTGKRGSLRLEDPFTLLDMLNGICTSENDNSGIYCQKNEKKLRIKT